jgi:hypothetical protein
MKTMFVRIAVKTVLALMLAGFSAKAQIIVDNSDPGFYASPAWATGTSSQAWGGTFRYRSTAPVSDPATWKVNLPSTGPYSVYAWWVSGPNRSAAAPYIITHGSSTTTVIVNQQVNGGSWNLLGTWTMAGQVKLSPWAATGYIVVADAIMWR